MDSLKNEIVRIVSEVNSSINLSEEDFDRPFDEVGIDSLDLMTILLEVNGQIGVDVPDEDIPGLTTLNLLAAYIKAKQ